MDKDDEEVSSTMCDDDDENGQNLLAIHMDWDFKVNGTCKPICGSTKACSA